MFRKVSLSIIRRLSLYTQQWYMSYSFADSLRAESRRNWFSQKDARGENTKINYGLDAREGKEDIQEKRG